MYRGFMTLVAVLGAALPAMAQDTDLRKEVEQLKNKVKALEAQKAAPAPERDLLDVDDKTIFESSWPRRRSPASSTPATSST